VGGGSAIDGVFDLDGDGQNELVMTSGFMSQGIIVVSARLSRFDHDQLVDVKTFGQVMESACGTGQPDSQSKVSIVRALVHPGKPLEFAVEQKTEPCR
jgi:hypothetical protein